jgi:transcriptional antiterminator RfaH
MAAKDLAGCAKYVDLIMAEVERGSHWRSGASREHIGRAASPIWYVVYTNIKCGKRAEEGLRRKGFDTFAPMSSRWVKLHGKRVEVQKALFPRYLFVGFEPGCSWLDLRETDGVEAVLGSAGAPLAVPSQLISDLQAAMIAGQFDEKPPASVAPGAQVKIMAGPFQGLYGRCKGLSGEARAEVLIELLKREAVVKIGLDELEVVG